MFVDIGSVVVMFFEILVLCLEIDEYAYYKDVYEYSLMVFGCVFEFEVS